MQELQPMDWIESFFYKQVTSYRKLDSEQNLLAIIYTPIE